MQNNKLYNDLYKHYAENVYPQLESYQKVNIQRAYKFEPKHYLAYEMGLGKSIVALCIAIQSILKQINIDGNFTNVKPTFIIPPAYIKLSWKDEIEKWFEPFLNAYASEIQSNPIKVIVSGKDKFNQIGLYEDIFSSLFVIMNYEQIDKFNNGLNGYLKHYKSINKNKSVTQALTEHQINALIVDEAHYIKNESTNRTKSLYKFATKLQPTYISLLSGTPINSSAEEFWSALKLLCKHKLFAENKTQFKKAFCNVVIDRFSGFPSYTGIRQPDLFNKLKESFYYYVTKDVIKHLLKGKRRQKLNVELTNKKQYIQAENDFVNFVNSAENEHLLENNITSQSKYYTMQKLATVGKIDYVSRFVQDNVVEGKNKLSIWCHFKVSSELIYNSLKEKYKNLTIALINGNVKVEDRHKIIQDFKQGLYDVVVMTYGSCSTGINLSFISKMLVVEPTALYYMLLQAEDRLYRRGQENVVNIYYAMADDTIETNVMYPKIVSKIVSFGQFNNELTIDKNNHGSFITDLYKQLKNN